MRSLQIATYVLASFILCTSAFAAAAQRKANSDSPKSKVYSRQEPVVVTNEGSELVEPNGQTGTVGGTSCRVDADCDTGNPCTLGSCNITGRCVESPQPEGTSCTDDENDCTLDTCDANGLCQHTPVTRGTSCSGDDIDCTIDRDVEFVGGNYIFAGVFELEPPLVANRIDYQWVIRDTPIQRASVLVINHDECWHGYGN